MTSTQPTLPGNSVIDKMRASGMSDDQIMAAIMSFGQTQTTQTPAPVINPNDHVGLLRSQGYTDEQITAQVVASAVAANHAGSGDPTAAGGVAPNVAELRTRLDAHAGNVANVQAAHTAQGERLAGVEGDINSHLDTLTDHESRLSWLEDKVRGFMRDAHDSTDDDAQKTDGEVTA